MSWEHYAWASMLMRPSPGTARIDLARDVYTLRLGVFGAFPGRGGAGSETGEGSRLV